MNTREGFCIQHYEIEAPNPQATGLPALGCRIDFVEHGIAQKKWRTCWAPGPVMGADFANRKTCTILSGVAMRSAEAPNCSMQAAHTDTGTNCTERKLGIRRFYAFWQST